MAASISVGYLTANLLKLLRTSGCKQLREEKKKNNSFQTIAAITFQKLISLTCLNPSSKPSAATFLKIILSSLTSLEEEEFSKNVNEILNKWPRISTNQLIQQRQRKTRFCLFCVTKYCCARRWRCVTGIYPRSGRCPSAGRPRSHPAVV